MNRLGIKPCLYQLCWRVLNPLHWLVSAAFAPGVHFQISPCVKWVATVQMQDKLFIIIQTVITVLANHIPYTNVNSKSLGTWSYIFQFRQSKCRHLWRAHKISRKRVPWNLLKHHGFVSLDISQGNPAFLYEFNAHCALGFWPYKCIKRRERPVNQFVLYPVDWIGVPVSNRPFVTKLLLNCLSVLFMSPRVELGPALILLPSCVACKSGLNMRTAGGEQLRTFRSGSSA